MAKELKKKTKTVSGADSKNVKKTARAKKTSKVKVAEVKTLKASKAATKTAKVEVVVPKAKRAEREVKRAEKKAAKRAERSQKRAEGKKARKTTEKAQRKGRKRWIFGLVALILVIVGGITAAVCLWEHEVPTEIVEEEPVEPEPEPELEPVGSAEGDEPLVPEVEMEDWSNYTVAPNKPRYLSIAALGLYNVPIIEVGTTNGGAMGAPNSSFTVGWYYRSAYPGRVGKWATVIDGHGGSLGDGIFRTLPNIGAGAEVVIEMGDGRKFTYVVTEKVLKPKGAEADAYMKIADRPVDAETPTLTLITCTGDWIRAEQTYTHRLFVRAVLK